MNLNDKKDERKVVSIRLPIGLIDRLDRLVEKQKKNNMAVRSLQGLVELAIEKFLDKNK